MATKQLSLSFHRLLQNGKDKAAVLQLQCTRDRSMRHVLLRLNNRSLTKSWLRWKSKVNQKKKMKRYVLKWISRRRLFVFLKWLDYVEARIRTRRLMVRVTTRMARTKLNSGFNSWILVTRHCFQLEKVKKENENKIRKTLLSMQKKTIFKTINTWKGYVLLRRKYRRCVYRMQNRTLLSVFNTWYDWVENAVAKRKKIRKVMLKMISKQLSMAFRSLVFNTTYQKDQEQIQCNRNRSMTHVLSRLNNRSLSKAWLRWKFRVLQKKKMKRYLCKWMKRQQLSVFMKWCEFVQNIFAQRLRMEKIIFRFVHTFKSKAFCKWQEVFKYETLVQAQQRQLERRTRRTSHVIFRIQHRTLTRVMNAWIHYRKQFVSFQKKMKRFIYKWMCRKKLYIFLSWLDYVKASVEKQKRRCKTARKMILAMYSRQLSLGFVTWKQYSQYSLQVNKIYVNQKKEEDKKEKKEKEKNKRKKETEEKAYLFKLENVKKKQNILIRKVIHQLKNKLVFKSFMKWKTAIQHSHQIRKTVHVWLLRTRVRTVANALHGTFQN